MYCKPNNECAQHINTSNVYILFNKSHMFNYDKKEIRIYYSLKDSNRSNYLQRIKTKEANLIFSDCLFYFTYQVDLLLNSI